MADQTQPTAAPAQDEVTFWRQDAAARLRTAITLAKAAEAKGEAERATLILVMVIMPTRAALGGALSGDIYYPLCEGCSKLLQPGDAVFQYEDVGEAHVDCDQPQLAELPEHAHRYVEDDEFSAEGIEKALAAADAYLNEEPF